MTDKQIAFEERAAIMELDGGLPRDEAERRARKIIEDRAEEPEQMNLPEPPYKSMLREYYNKL